MKGTTPHRNDTFSAVGGMAVTKADSDIVYPVNALFPRGFMVGDAGTVRVTLWDGSVMDYADGELVKGLIYPWAVRRVHSTGTGASLFKVYW